MRILWNEIKKILNWRILLLLLLMNLVVFFLFIEFHLTHFPNGRPELDSYNIGVEMVNTYGTTMDEGDFLDFKKTYKAQVKEADHYIQSRKEFQDVGIHSYEDFRNRFRNQDGNEEQMALADRVMFEEEVDLFWELLEREALSESHDQREEELARERDNANAKQKVRLDELKKAGNYQAYPGVALRNYNSFIGNVAIAIILSVALVISPVFIKDRSNGLLHLQYTTKKGRNLYKLKVVAAFISILIVTSALLIVYFGLYSLNNIAMFFKVPMYMFIGDYYWYDLTFFEYIILTVLAVYILGSVFSLLAMSISNVSPNYISLIGIQIPLIVVMISYGLPYLIAHIINIRMPQWLIPTAYSVMVVISVTFIVFIWKREKTRDILI